MTRTDDDAAERARLERIAWGAGATPAEAARARVALADLAAGRRPVPAPSGVVRRQDRPAAVDGVGHDRRAVSARAAAAPDPVVDAPRPGQLSIDGEDGAGHVEGGDVTGVGPTGPDGSVGAPVADGRRGGPVPDTTVAVRGRDRSVAALGPDRSVDDDPDRVAPDDSDRDSADTSAGTSDRDRAGAAAATVGASVASAPGGRLSGLLGGARGLRDRVRRADRTALWVAAGVAVVVGLAVGTGAGVAVGTGRSAQSATATITPTPGTVTVEQLLAAPQTYADQLPGSVDAPVMLRSTRLVFTNRSLSGDDASTPWAVWAGTGRDGKMVCLVASADRLEGSSACYPRADALHGTVSMTAMSSSGTLWVSLKGGAVLATVTGSY